MRPIRLVACVFLGGIAAALGACTTVVGEDEPQFEAVDGVEATDTRTRNGENGVITQSPATRPLPGDDAGSPPSTDAGQRDAANDTGAEGGKDGGKGTVDAASPPDSGGSSSGSSSGGIAPTCRVTRAGATGPEPGGMIPVCCAPAAAARTQIDEVFRLLNLYRVQQGKAALLYDANLEASVQGHCEHMKLHGFFSHYAPEQAVYSPFDRAPLCGANAYAENLAAGQSTPAAAMDQWRNSAGHNANMLANYRTVGICRAGNYWGQLFGY